MYKSLFKVLNYKFEDISLLELALSHKSLGSKDNNERLEFLGDAILGAVIAEELFLKFPDITEGQMTRIRASLVKGSTLRKKSKLLQLPKYVKASKAAKNLKNLNDSSIFSTVFEALLGAIYLDSSWLKVRQVILGLYEIDFCSIDKSDSFKDPKSILQEFLQAKGERPTQYNCKKITTKGKKNFSCSAIFDGFEFQAYGNSKKTAQMKVAQKILRALDR